MEGMLIQIGASKEPSGAVDLLLECHKRIRFFTELALNLARAHNVSHDEIRDAAARVARYFSTALPLHIADEEQSILPRLSGRSPELDSTLKAMHREHEEHEQQLRVLLDICRRLSASPEQLDELRHLLMSTASNLETAFGVHLEQEERIVFPAIATLLLPDEQAAILAEVRLRRDRDSA
jgi:iron-sulfur cluster repair protein YtfE (RIC family)